MKYDFYGTIFGVIGAFIIASNTGLNHLGYIFFLLSSILYIIFGIKIDNLNIIVLNIVFIIANILGLINYWN